MKKGRTEGWYERGIPRKGQRHNKRNYGSMEGRIGGGKERRREGREGGRKAERKEGRNNNA